MEYLKLVKKITDWNSIGIRTEGRPNNRSSDEVICDLKKVKGKGKVIPKQAYVALRGPGG
jgi:hypothetical protein